MLLPETNFVLLKFAEPPLIAKSPVWAVRFVVPAMKFEFDAPMFFVAVASSEPVLVNLQPVTEMSFPATNFVLPKVAAPPMTVKSPPVAVRAVSPALISEFVTTISFAAVTSSVPRTVSNQSVKKMLSPVVNFVLPSFAVPPLMVKLPPVAVRFVSPALILEFVITISFAAVASNVPRTYSNQLVTEMLPPETNFVLPKVAEPPLMVKTPVVVVNKVVPAVSVAFVTEMLSSAVASNE